jgi:Rho-binding antiterminator
VTTSDYRPIACAAYSELEVLILRGGEIELRLGDAGERVRGVPRDLRTRGGVEYLVLRVADGEDREIRLDGFALVAPGTSEGG